jgi:hypothetical protein
MALSKVIIGITVFLPLIKGDTPDPIGGEGFKNLEFYLNIALFESPLHPPLLKGESPFQNKTLNLMPLPAGRQV